MKKKLKLFAGVLAALMCLSAVLLPASAAEESAAPVYIRTEKVPKEFDDYATDMFKTFGKNTLYEMRRYDGMRVLPDKSQKAVLGKGYIAKRLNGENVKDIVCYPIIVNGKITGGMNVSWDGDRFGCSAGTFDEEINLSDVTTSPEFPAEIYATENAVYAVVGEEVTVLNYQIPYNENEVAEEIEALKKIYSKNYSDDYEIISTSKKSGKVASSGKFYYFKSGIMQRNTWVTVKGKKAYYAASDGTLATGKYTVDGKEYRFSESGKLISG